jgi:hypothetical protein
MAADEILPYLYLGGRDAARDKDWLTAQRVRYILNMTHTRTDDPQGGVANFFESDRAFV